MTIPHYLSLSQYKGRRVHLGITGSIAAYKTLDLCRDLQRTGIETSAVLTSAAAKFITRLSLEALGVSPVQTRMFSRDHSTFDHLEPGQNSSMMLVVPATANTLAKLAHGLADNLLTCQALAFPGPLLIVPAMNPNLWTAPATEENTAKLQERENISVLAPDSGEVACGDQGSGKLPPLLDIYFQALKSMTPQDMSGLNILITLGSTREFWDPVRFWSNPSTGRMGAALALTAWLRGAEVRCLCGPNDVWLPAPVKTQEVVSAREMHAACLDVWPRFDIGCLCAAVCDFRPCSPQEQKFKKVQAGTTLRLSFEKNPDILAELGRQKTSGQRLIGFAAETDSDLFQAALDKLDRKNLDLVCANRINIPEAGFAQHTNSVLLVNKQHTKRFLPVMSKADIAWKIWDWTLAQ